MANIKISELNSLSKKANNDVLPIVDVSADETKKIKIEDLLDKNVSLIAVSDTAPDECSTGDKYFNTTTNLIYTAIATDTWSETGEEPIEGIFYVVFNEQSSYAYNGTTLVSVGGGTEDIIISDEEPTTDDWKIWIDSGEVNNLGSEVVDSLTGNETNFAPSVRAVKEDLNTYSTTEQRIGTWTDGKPLYRKVIENTGYATSLITPVNGTIDSIVNVQGMVKRGDYSNYYMPIPSRASESTYKLDFQTIVYSSTNSNITVNFLFGTGISDMIGTTGKIIIILEYTKTTD